MIELALLVLLLVGGVLILGALGALAAMHSRQSKINQQQAVLIKRIHDRTHGHEQSIRQLVAKTHRHELALEVLCAEHIRRNESEEETENDDRE